jgi:hypothetical protein
MGEAEDKVMKISDKMREVNELLKYTAERKSCKVKDLQWKVDKGGHIHIRRKSNAV